MIRNRAPLLVTLSFVVAACATAVTHPPRDLGETSAVTPTEESSAEPVTEPVASAMSSSSAVGSASAAVAPDTRPRIASTSNISWIYSKPSKDSNQIGWVRVGTSVPLKSTEAIKAVGCPNGWFALDPQGYVCDDATLTRDLDDAYVKALSIATPHYEEAMPYRYALSGHAPMYTRLPTEEEQIKIEGPRELRPPPPGLLKWSRGHEELANLEGGVAATDEMPEVFRDHKQVPTSQGAQGALDHRVLRKWIPLGSMLSYSHAFAFGGRTWLVTPDLSLVPADRVRAFKTSTFQGVSIAGDIALPLGWSRHDPVKKYRKSETGFEATAETWPRRTPIPLKARIEDGTRVFWETREAGIYALESDLGVATQAEKMPLSVPEGDHWIEIKGKAGTLVAYEGLKPVYATLMSTGQGGVGYGDNATQVRNSTTPVGLYRIQSKERVATMSPDKGEPTAFWIADVPYTQYFRAPFAIHSSYWHEDFGVPKSAGCVNVAPLDGRWLFSWTDPKPIPTWAATVPAKSSTGLGTWVQVLL